MKFLKKIFSPTILVISVLLLIYTFYKSEIIYDGYRSSYYKTYYLIFSIIICFSIITFFINYKIKEYLIIFFISLILSLYLFEGYLTFKEQFSKEQEKLYEKQTGNKWDRRNRLEIYKDLKKNNNKITINFPPPLFLDKNYSFFPLSGLSNSETIMCNDSGVYSIYQSDRYGFNNPDNEWDKKEIEYLLVGDSFTQGECVNRPNDISSVLRNLSNKSVLNLGMSGNGPLIEYATLREYLNKKVKKVLWIYYEGNDLVNLKNENKNNILISYLKDLNFTQNLKFKQNDIDSLLLNLVEEKTREGNTFKFNLIKFIIMNKTRFAIFPKLTPEPISEYESLPEFKEILQFAKELTNKNNSKIYFVYLPEYSRYKTTFDDTNYNLIKNILTELKIPIIDIHKEVFVKEQNPLKLFPFELPGHYNIYGYKKVAEIIYKFTKD